VNEPDLRALPAAVAEHARTAPDTKFLTEVDGESLTYGQAQARADVWSEGLARHGVTAGDTVLSLLPNIADCVCAWLGIAALRAIEVPVHTAAKGRMLSYFANDSRAEVALVGERLLPDLLAVGDQLEHLRTIVVLRSPGSTAPLPVAAAPLRLLDSATFLAGCTGLTSSSPPGLSDLATILYTSGTTGPSKGVMVPWGQLWQTATGLNPLDDLTSADTFYCPHPLFHNGGKSVVSLAGLLGGQIIIRDRFRTSTFWDDVRSYGCTTAMLIGSMVAFLESQPPHENDAAGPLRNVYPVPLPVDADGFCERFGVRLHAWFGMSECGVPICTTDWNARNTDGCGRPRPGFSVRVVDDQDRPVEEGRVGELVLRADEPWLMNVGYWANAEKTAEAWRNLWLHTGDAARVDQHGNVHFVDRLKDAIRRRGENISSTEVEAEVNEFPDVQESAVVGVESRWAEQEVLSFVVPVPGSSVEPAALHAFLIERMPRFMVPRFIAVVDDLPRTPTGKVRKVELRERGRADAWDAEQDT
jgi:crotonobetaine/carnitine-CoA ligase